MNEYNDFNSSGTLGNAFPSPLTTTLISYIMYPSPMKIYQQILAQRLWHPIITTVMNSILYETAKTAYETQCGNISANYTQLNPGLGM